MSRVEWIEGCGPCPASECESETDRLRRELEKERELRRQTEERCRNGGDRPRIPPDRDGNCPAGTRAVTTCEPEIPTRTTTTTVERDPDGGTTTTTTTVERVPPPPPPPGEYEIPNEEDGGDEPGLFVVTQDQDEPPEIQEMPVLPFREMRRPASASSSGGGSGGGGGARRGRTTNGNEDGPGLPDVP